MYSGYMDTQAPPAQTAPHVRRKKTLLYVISGIILVLVAVAGWLAFSIYQSSHTQIPSSITAKAKFPLYVPAKLPGTYKVNQKSFAFDNDTLIFSAKDLAGGSIVFSQQKQPKNFDFNKFYKEDMTNAKTLNNVPYASVFGKSKGATIISIVTDTTWIIGSTSSPFDEGDMQIIAASLRK